MRKNILVVDDDRDIVEELRDSLTDEGYYVRCSLNGEGTWEEISNHQFDLVLLDLSLPDTNGITIAREIRRRSDVGIIMLTHRDAEVDIVAGLETGADDYVAKPFSRRQLIARVRSVMRRTEGNVLSGERADATGDFAYFANWSLDMAGHVLHAPSGDKVSLTALEFALLRTFVQRPQRVLGRQFILDRIHGRHWSGFDRGIDGLVSRLRRKLKLAYASVDPLIVTVRGSGYMFNEIVTRSQGTP